MFEKIKSISDNVRLFLPILTVLIIVFFVGLVAVQGIKAQADNDIDGVTKVADTLRPVAVDTLDNNTSDVAKIIAAEIKKTAIRPI